MTNALFGGKEFFFFFSSLACFSGITSQDVLMGEKEHQLGKQTTLASVISKPLKCVVNDQMRPVLFKLTVGFCFPQ